MRYLPLKVIEPFEWWLIKAPKKIFIVLKRIIALINNEVSFTLNIKLLFTPFFGDYTRVGRIIGFIFRLLGIILGVIIVIPLLLLTFILPVVWWVLPGFLLFYFPQVFVPLAIVVFVLRIITRLDVPYKKVNDVSSRDFHLCFRPKARRHLNDILSKGPKAIPKLTETVQISYLLKKLELTNTEFLHNLSYEKSLNGSNLAHAAYEYAKKQKARFVELEHLFLAVLVNISNAKKLLDTYGSSLEECEGAVSWVVGEREALAKIFFWQDDYEKEALGGIGKGMTGRVTPMLDAVSEDFTKLAKKGLLKNIVGRDEEIEKIAELLGGSRTNVLIIGAPGSGKTAIVRGMANRVIRGTKYRTLWSKRIVRLETGALISGAKTSGDIAEKLTKVMEEVEASGDIILFIDEIHNLVSGVSGDSADVSSIYSILEPYLSAGKIQFVGATSIENYRKHIEPNGAFSRLFETVKIEPASKKDTIEILKFVSADFEKEYKVLISFPALAKIVELSDKLIHERVLPDKAIDILNRCVVSVAQDAKYVTSEVAATQISELTQIPVAAISKDESAKLLNIESEMKQHVIGQDAAIEELGKALKRARVGIRNEEKPIASFLFVGTTGVGKTETAKTLSKIYFGDVKNMIRRDMSEFQQVDSINKLIGTPDGNTAGSLTDSVRSRPFALILLDEIEKAYPSVLHTFLQVLDDGRLTDTTGRVVDFTNTIIIATSNVGTREIQKVAQRKDNFKNMQEAALRKVHEHFAPEFLNRFNGIIVFRPLTKEDVKKIADLMLNRVRNMAEEKGVTVGFKPELIEELAKRGYNPKWGARPLARVIENSVETYLAVKLLKKEVESGDTLELGIEVFDNQGS